MTDISKKNVTQMLQAWSDGDQNALDELFAMVYEELHRLAGAYMRRERPNHTLQPTALINEAYLRLVDHSAMNWQNRAHFFGVAAKVMRHILTDYARSRGTAKRGGNVSKLVLDEGIASDQERDIDLIKLDEALGILEKINPEQSKIVELRFFGGLSIEETAKVLGVSDSTIKRQWNVTKAWLYRQLN